MNSLTPGQEEYFRTLAKLDPSDDMRRVIEDAKADLEAHGGDRVVRGLTRLKGFTPNK